MWIFCKRHIIVPIIFILCIYVSSIGSKKHGSKSNESQEQTEEIACEREKIKSDNGLIVHIWKTKYLDEPTLYATSTSGTCLKNKTNELLVRKCEPMTGQWMPEATSITCANIPKQKNVFCPEDLIEIAIRDKFICLKITDDARVFDETYCYGSDTLLGEKFMKPFEIAAILKYLSKEQKIKQFWLPIRRATYNKYYNPFVVRLPGVQWGEVYEMPTQLHELFTVKHCLSAEIVNDVVSKQLNLRSVMTNCSTALPMVCIFRKEFVAYSGCPQGFGALAHKPNECFGIDWEADLFPYDLRALSIAEYIKQRNTLQHIFYSLDLEKERFFLIGNFSSAPNAQNFNIEMNSNEEFRIVPYNGRHHALSYERLTTQNRKSVEMILNINTKFGGLVLTIYNRNYIWRFSDKNDNYGVKCFTNSEADEVQWKTVKIKLIWQNTLETKAMFELNHSNNDGYYWCEAHTIFEFSHIKTEKKTITNGQKKGHTYALLLELNCDALECYNLYAENTWKRLSKKAKKLLNNLINERSKYKQQFKELEITHVRLMDIAEIFNNYTTLRSLIHVTAYLKSTHIDQDSEESSEEWDSKESDFDMATIVRLKIQELLTELVALINKKATSTVVRSTTFCFPATFYMANKEVSFWQLSKYRQTATTSKLCLQENGIPVIRACLGNFLWGAYWDNAKLYNKSLPCYLRKLTEVITYELRELDSKRVTKTSPAKAITNVRNLLEHNINKIIPADFYYISRIMQSTMKSLLRSFNLTATNTNEYIAIEIARIYNYLMEVNEHIVKSSALLNSTNVLLEVFERLMDESSFEIIQKKIALRNSTSTSTSTTSSPSSSTSAEHSLINTYNLSEKIVSSIKKLRFEDIGVVVKIAKNFVIFILDPNVANITGVALYQNNASNSAEKDAIEVSLEGGLFNNEAYRFIMANQSIDDLLYETELQLATYVPASLLQRFDEISRAANITTVNSSVTRIVIKIYANDILFQETVDLEKPDENSDKIVAGKIVSVSIPGHDKDLPEMLPLIFKIPKSVNTHNDTTIGCSYWNYDIWADDGLTYLGHALHDPSIILCGCTHLTPFAYLVGSTYKMSSAFDPATVIVVETHQKVLDVITILGCSLSIFGTIGIFITAVTFQSWRQKASSKVLLQLAAAITLQMIVFCFINTAEISQQLMASNIYASCIAIGALLHYSVLLQFSWMIIIGYLQFKRYVQVFGNTRPTRFFKKSSIIGWGAPLIPVILVLIFDRKSYIPEGNSSITTQTQSICYPTGYALYLAVLFPITLIIIANFIIFAIIVHNILRGPAGTLRHTEKKLALSQLRLSVLLFFLLGFTWIFGLLASLKAGIIFSYLFCLTATLQGFVIFIYFVILDPNTRRMWSGFFYNFCGLKENYENSSSTKDTTQTLR